ncbi:cupin-like domain-containing protein [Tunturiibacter lichenicola]|uniref:cupin-like domain-containing protein n=1 Tax=Tunturiibacter lichenicola TaxID=2051959 RepID=UPI0021B44F47|nr:cupin-like domain-containing protein [Edaphobacter lichenicola]
MSAKVFREALDLKEKIFEFNDPTSRTAFDEKSFEFRHNLTSDHPLFTRERLRRLLTSPATKKNVSYNAGEIRVDQSLDSVPERTRPVEEVFDSLENAGAWIAAHRVNEDPAYRQLLEDCLSEVKRLSGRVVDNDKKTHEADIYITSPGRVTMYHVDPICNFLMQVSGEKQIHIFDRNDREVLPEEELERFWSEDNYAATYPLAHEDRAKVFTLRPGAGVHIPLNNPHWLKNGDAISISLSINYQYKDTTRKNVYQANYYLRKMGLKPRPLGNSPFVDSVKASAVTLTHAVSTRLRRLKMKGDVPVMQGE